METERRETQRRETQRRETQRRETQRRGASMWASAERREAERRAASRATEAAASRAESIAVEANRATEASIAAEANRAFKPKDLRNNILNPQTSNIVNSVIVEPLNYSQSFKIKLRDIQSNAPLMFLFITMLFTLTYNIPQAIEGGSNSSSNRQIVKYSTSKNKNKNNEYDLLDPTNIDRLILGFNTMNCGYQSLENLNAKKNKLSKKSSRKTKKAHSSYQSKKSSRKTKRRILFTKLPSTSV